MSLVDSFRKLSTCCIADALDRAQVMNYQIKALWNPIPRIAGPAFTVKCVSGDNLMLHAAIYRATAGSIIVVESEDCRFAVAGGNVCAVAQKRNIAGFIVDGVVRDLEEIRTSRFPVFARGVVPKPGKKEQYTPLNCSINCGEVSISAHDILVADEEGIVVVPQLQAEVVLKSAQKRADTDANTPLEVWQQAHQKKINAILEASE